MVESGEQERPSEDPRSRFARLSAEIDKARRQFAALRHEGERHYIDDQPVDAEVPAVLRDIVAQSDELAALQSMSTGTTDVNRAFTSAEIDDQHQRLDDLETRISTLNRLAGDDPHRHEQHFIDG
jgi:hypothetical protein